MFSVGIATRRYISFAPIVVVTAIVGASNVKLPLGVSEGIVAVAAMTPGVASIVM